MFAERFAADVPLEIQVRLYLQQDREPTYFKRAVTMYLSTDWCCWSTTLATQISTPQTLHYYWHGSITDAMLYRIFRYAVRVKDNSSEMIQAKVRFTYVPESYLVCG
jgi:hypothetical protein